MIRSSLAWLGEEKILLRRLLSERRFSCEDHGSSYQVYQAAEEHRKRASAYFLLRRFVFAFRSRKKATTKRALLVTKHKGPWERHLVSRQGQQRPELKRKEKGEE